MPASELEILWVLTCQFIADVVEWLAIKRMIARQVYFYAYHEVHLLIAQMVGSAMGEI
jgi:hypothetical protein